MARPTPLERIRRMDQMWWDALISVALMAVGVGSQFMAPSANPDAYRDTDALAVALGLGVTVPLFLRRRAPLGALMVSCASITVLSMADYVVNSLPTAVLLLTYTAGANASPSRSRAAIGVVESAIVVIRLSGAPDMDTGGMLFNMALFGVAWLGGEFVRGRASVATARLAEAEERAEAHRQHAARALAEERLRIAQELHDVVAHSMSVIAVQAGMGLHVMDRRPAEARGALEAISKTSRSTLAEMRRLLGALRGEDGERVVVPSPGLSDLRALVEEVRAAGVPVTLCVQGPVDTVPLGVELSAYRLVQESLTNVMKHAGPASVAVIVRAGPDGLVVEVTDDGRGAASAGARNGGGHGLLGMRERVAVFGGSLEAGPMVGGGYRVTARLPYEQVP